MDPASIFRIGTSGYSFPDWVGPFYPPGKGITLKAFIRTQDRLRKQDGAAT